MSMFNRSAAAVKPGPAQDPVIKNAALAVAPQRPELATPAGNLAGLAASAARDAMFEKLSKMFRRAGTDVAAQALFRVIMEYRVETLEKQK
jgi:hypothetical protein